MNLNEINSNLQAEFALKKINAEKLANENIFKAKQNKNFEPLVLLERETELALAKEKTAEKPNKKQIASLEKTLADIREVKCKLLSSYSLSPSDLVPKYECQICKDSGFVGTQPCSCFVKRKNEELIKSYGLSGKELCDFNSFDENVFSDEKQKTDSITLKNKLESWCEKFPNISKNKIVLLGETGVGKTFLTKCMAKRLSEKNVSVCFLSAFEINNLMLKYHTTFDNSKLSILKPILEIDALFIDDLGTEPILNNVSINYLFLILSERERFDKPTIITTNLSAENLKERYGERIFSRLSDKKSGIMLKVSGEDIRTKKR